MARKLKKARKPLAYLRIDILLMGVASTVIQPLTNPYSHVQDTPVSVHMQTLQKRCRIDAFYAKYDAVAVCSSPARADFLPLWKICRQYGRGIPRGLFLFLHTTTLLASFHMRKIFLLIERTEPNRITNELSLTSTFKRYNVKLLFSENWRSSFLSLDKISQPFSQSEIRYLHMESIQIFVTYWACISQAKWTWLWQIFA